MTHDEQSIEAMGQKLLAALPNQCRGTDEYVNMLMALAAVASAVIFSHPENARSQRAFYAMVEAQLSLLRQKHGAVN